MPIEKWIVLRTTQERKKLIATAAAYSGKTLNVFLLEAAEERAKNVIKEQTQLQLSLKDWEAFSQILDKAESKPRPRLEALVQQNSGE